MTAMSSSSGSPLGAGTSRDRGSCVADPIYCVACSPTDGSVTDEPGMIDSWASSQVP